MDANTPHPRAMLVNVGGASSPAVYSLNKYQPDYICFFVSKESKGAIQNSILPNLNYNPQHYDWIQTESPQSLLECYKKLAQELPRILAKWEVKPEELAVEYTAGTKPMSVAAVLVTIDTSSIYLYVGSRDPEGRDRDGLGVVIDGKEFSWFQSNPWEELAVKERANIAMIFNLGRFADAKARALKLANVVPQELKIVYNKLADLIEGYDLWDRFEYQSAQIKIASALKDLKIYTAGRNDPLKDCFESVQKNINFLERRNFKAKKQQAPEDKTKIKDAHRADVLDMIANAIRRAAVGKYDDAAARLYSTLETLARFELNHTYQIDNGKARPDQIPETIREEFIRRFQDTKDPNILRIGLLGSYTLLAELKNSLGLAYFKNQNELSQVLNARNMSRLAHSDIPVSEDLYKRMLNIVMTFANVSEDELPKFPELTL